MIDTRKTIKRGISVYGNTFNLDIGIEDSMLN